MNAECVIVDANIAFKCLITGRGDLRERFGPGGYSQLFTPSFLFVELFKHKDRLVRSSGLNEADIPVGTGIEAYRLCKGVDENDTPYVALTLHLAGRFWTEDGALKGGRQARGFDRFFLA